jgi:hypothetical protein
MVPKRLHQVDGLEAAVCCDGTYGQTNNPAEIERDLDRTIEIRVYTRNTIRQLTR